MGDTTQTLPLELSTIAPDVKRICQNCCWWRDDDSDWGECVMPYDAHSPVELSADYSDDPPVIRLITRRGFGCNEFVKKEK